MASDSPNSDAKKRSSLHRGHWSSNPLSRGIFSTRIKSRDPFLRILISLVRSSPLFGQVAHLRSFSNFRSPELLPSLWVGLTSLLLATSRNFTPTTQNTMFAKIAIHLIALSALASKAFAGPVALRPKFELAVRGSRSFNNWGGHNSMANFDNFYGIDNFDGSHFSSESQVIVHQEHEVVCHTQQVEIIQQQLVVLQEMAKRIITEQICEVESQTIVFEQWHASLHGFSRDLRRHTGRSVGFDRRIAGHFSELINVDGSLSTHNLGFTGHDIGGETVVVGGHNWVDNISPVTVEDAFSASRFAVTSLHPDLF